MNIQFFDSIENFACDKYFYLDGISDKLGFKRYEDIGGGNLQELPPQAPNYLFTALKILSFFTVILPVFALVGKILDRCCGKTFQVGPPLVQTLPAPTQIQAEPPLSQTEPAVTQVVPPPPPAKTQAVPPAPQTKPTCGKVPPAPARTEAAPPPAPLTVGTYNVLFPQSPIPSKFTSPLGYSLKRETGELYTNWNDFRFPIVRDNILKANLDVVCLQEVTQETMIDLQASPLKDKYQFVWQAHLKNSHGVALLFDRNRFALLGQQTPEINIRKTDGFNQKRVHVITDLQDKTTNKVYRVASCHLIDARSLAKKDEHVQQILETMDQPTPYGITAEIVAGDMNQDQFGDIGTARPANPGPHHATAFQPFLAGGYKADDDLTSSEYTKAGYDNSPIVSKERRIDWIWARGGEPKPLPLPHFDNRGSDHRLVAAIV